MLIHTGPSTTVRPLLYMLSSSILILTSGLEALIKLVTKWRKEPTTYSPTEMTATLDQLKVVLFEHLDQEVRFCLRLPVLYSILILPHGLQVKDLQGDQLKLHFTLNEIESLSRI